MVNKIRDQIINLVNSNDFQELVSYYSQKSFFNILNISRKEAVHSDFLAWLFNPGSTHELGDYPLRKLLETIILPINRSQNKDKGNKFPEDLEDIIISGNYSISDAIIEREKNTGNGFIDIYIDLNLFIQNNPSEARRLRIIVENKVKSKEGDIQTERYYKWAKKLDQLDNCQSVFVFLTPLNNTSFEKLTEPECLCKSYIQLNYQYLVDYTIEPCRKRRIPNEAEILINNYIRTLSFPAILQDDNERGDIIMAIGERERLLLRNFWDANKELLIAVITALKDDPEISEEEQQMIDNGLNAVIKVGSKDNTKYRFQDNIYPKNRLVLAVVKQYVKDNSPIVFEDLKNIFPDNLQGSLGVVRPRSEAQKIMDEGGIPRHFLKDNELISLEDMDVAVCNQWGIGNINKFIKRSIELKYEIKPEQ